MREYNTFVRGWKISIIERVKGKYRVKLEHTDLEEPTHLKTTFTRRYIALIAAKNFINNN